MLTICPCKGCADRTAVCHGKCEKYTEWREEREKMKTQMAAEFYDPLRDEKQKHFDNCAKLYRKAGFYGN